MTSTQLTAQNNNQSVAPIVAQKPVGRSGNPILTVKEWMAKNNNQSVAPIVAKRPVGRSGNPILTVKEWMAKNNNSGVSTAEDNVALKDVPLEALRNIPESAGRFFGGLYDAISNPGATAMGVLDLGAGALRSILPGTVVSAVDKLDSPENVKRISDTAKAAGNMLDARYGSFQKAKNTVAKDPVAFLADFSTLFTGGAGLAARSAALAAGLTRVAPGIARVAPKLKQTAAVLNAVATRTDPLMIAGRIAKQPTKLGAHVLGFTSGAGSDAVKRAVKSGREGGAASSSFTGYMRGTRAADEIVGGARKAVEVIRNEAGAAYKAGMKGVTANKTVLPFGNINKAVNDVYDRGFFNAENINESAAGIWDKINEKVDRWKNRDPLVYHTPEGLDALKQSIWDIGKDPTLNTKSSDVIGKVYNAIKDEITKAFPDYAIVMKDYEAAKKLLLEMEQTLKSTPRANIDTALRALQTILNKNANSKSKRRVELGELLEKAGAKTLLPSIAGLAFSSPTPRSLQGLGSAIALGVGGLSNPAALFSLAATSPRIVGEVSHATGKSLQLADALKKSMSKLKINPRVAAQIGYQFQQLEREDQGNQQ